MSIEQGAAKYGARKNDSVKPGDRVQTKYEGTGVVQRVSGKNKDGEALWLLIMDADGSQDSFPESFLTVRR